MSKRPGFQYRQPRSKMPKLNITISSSQRSQVAGPSRINNVQQTEVQQHQEDMWGDDDDEEYIMLASQVVEKLDANAELIISQSMNTLDADLSYRRFQRDVRTSTQHQSPIMSEFDNDFGEDILAIVPDVVSKPVAKPVLATMTNETQSMRSIDAKNTEKAKLEVNHLTEKNKAQKREIENLKETLKKLNEKCQIKEGEASTLRYELELNRKTMDKIRKDRMAENMQVEKEYNEKISRLEKTIETERSKSEFKSIEMHKKSRRTLNDSTVIEPETLSATELHNMFKLHISDSPKLVMSTSSSTDTMTAMKLEAQKGLIERDNELQNNLHILQSIYSSTKTADFVNFDEKTKMRITTIATYLMGVLLNYINTLEAQPFHKYNPSTELKALSDTIINNNQLNSTKTAQRKFTNNPAYEKLVNERQMLIVIALLTGEHSCVANSLLYDQLDAAQITKIHGEEIDLKNQTFVSCLVNIVNAIGCAKTLNSHKGFIESASIMLVSLTKNYLPKNGDEVILLKLFKAIVFCEPGLNSLYRLSEFLEIVSNSWTISLCNKICQNENNNVLSYQSYNINRYSMDTCPLQVFSCLLQVAFEPYEDHLPFSEMTAHLKMLTQITIRMMTFLHNCMKLRADWLFRKNSLSDNPQTPHCYCHIVSCIIVLLHFCMKSWNRDHRLIDSHSIEAIFKLGTIFLYDTINKNFEPNVLTLGGFSIKNRLQAIYDWILSHMHLFSFEELHTNAINAVNLRRIIWLNEPQMVNSVGQQRAEFLKDTTIVTNSFQDFQLF